MTYRAYTDGASRGNPGESGIGIVVRDEERAEILAYSGYLGLSTNNRAEYAALITLLERAREFRCARLIVHSDSELMVRQMAGEYRVKDQTLKVLFRKAASLIQGLPFPVEMRHIPREENGEADRLANLAIDARGPSV